MGNSLSDENLENGNDSTTVVLKPPEPEAEARFYCKNCGTSEYEEELYYCNECDANGSAEHVLCEECGNLRHKNLSHKFVTNMQCVNLGVKKGSCTQGMTDDCKDTTPAESSGPRKLCTQIAKGRIQGKGEYIGVSNGGIATVCAVSGTSGIASSAAVQGLGIGAVCVAELTYLSKQYYQGKITWDEFGWRLCSKIATCNVASYAGCVTASATSKMIASGVGTGVTVVAGSASAGAAASAATAITVGAIGACVVGTGYSVAADYVFDRLWPQQAENQKEIDLENARLQFFFAATDMSNPRIFNHENVMKRYDVLAKECDPKRLGGSETAMNQLDINLGYLLAVLQDNKKD